MSTTFNDYKKKWRLANDAVSGSGGFADGSHINKFLRESDEDLKIRKDEAWFNDIFNQKLSRYLGYFTSKTPSRTTSNNLLDIIIKDADRFGKDMNAFMLDIARKGKAKGSTIVIVDMPTELPPNRLEQIQNRAVPYFTHFAPEDLLSYEVLPSGLFNYIEIPYTAVVGGEVKQVTKRYDTTGWQIKDEDKIIEQGEHNLGVCQAVAFTEQGLFPSLGEFANIPTIVKRLYNVDSEIDTALRDTALSILVFKGKSTDSLEIGTKNALRYPDEKPSFIAPSGVPFEAYEKRQARLEAIISDRMYDLTLSKAAETTESLEYKFKALDSSLSLFSTRLELFERQIFEIAQMFLGIEDQIHIQYGRSFVIRKPENEVKILESLSDLGYDIPAYEAMKLKTIIQNDLGDIAPDVWDDIVTQVDATVANPASQGES